MTISAKRQGMPRNVKPALIGFLGLLRAGKKPAPRVTEWMLQEAGFDEEQAARIAADFERGDVFSEDASAEAETRSLIASLRSFQLER